MANLVLKPQVTAFLDVVTTATGPDLQLAEIEVRETSSAAGRTIRDLRIRHETGALVVSLRKADGSFDTTPEPDTPIEVGDVLIGVGSPDEIQALGRPLRRRARALPADPVRTLAAALADAAGAELELERPGEPEHGDYATNVALRLAGTRRRPPREIAAEIAQAAAGLEVVERAEVAGPGFVNLFLRDEWFASALAEILEDGDGVRRRRRRAAGSACRSRWSPRTRRARSRSRPPATAPTATRSPACSSSRVTRSSASTTTTTRARRWSGSGPRSRRCGAARSRRRTATRARTSTTSPP